MLFEGQIHDLMLKLPWVQTKKEKNSLRAIIEQRRRIYDAELAKADSAAIVARIEELDWFKQAQVVMLYYPIHNEVDLRELVHKYKGQKTFLLPVTHRKWIEPRRYEGEDKLRKGHHHIMEPQTEPYKGNIDLILVPGVVFDNQLNRIGRGGGYYDRFLKKQKHAHHVGVCYDLQLRKREVPHQYFDKKVHCVVTPTQTIRQSVH